MHETDSVEVSHWKGFQRNFIPFHSHTDVERFRFGSKKKESKNVPAAVMGWEKLYIVKWRTTEFSVHNICTLTNRTTFPFVRFVFSLCCFAANILFFTTSASARDECRREVYSFFDIRAYRIRCERIYWLLAWWVVTTVELENKWIKWNGVIWFHCNWKIQNLIGFYALHVWSKTLTIWNMDGVAFSHFRHHGKFPERKKNHSTEYVFGTYDREMTWLRVPCEASSHMFECRHIFFDRSQSSSVRAIQYTYTCIGIEIWFAKGISLSVPEASDSSLVEGVRRAKQEVTMQWRRIDVDDADTNGEQLPRCGLETQFNQCDAADAGRRRQHTPYLIETEYGAFFCLRRLSMNT